MVMSVFTQTFRILPDIEELCSYLGVVDTLATTRCWTPVDCLDFLYKARTEFNSPRTNQIPPVQEIEFHSDALRASSAYLDFWPDMGDTRSSRGTEGVAIEPKSKSVTSSSPGVPAGGELVLVAGNTIVTRGNEIH